MRYSDHDFNLKNLFFHRVRVLFFRFLLQCALEQASFEAGPATFQLEAGGEASTAEQAGTQDAEISGEKSRATGYIFFVYIDANP